MWRFLFIAFLIAHGALHLVMWLRPIDPEPAFNVHSSWLVGVPLIVALLWLDWPTEVMVGA